MTVEPREAAGALVRALERSGFRGWDPFDALASPVLRALARTPRQRQLAIQALKRSPVNLRRALGVPQLEHTKAIALLCSAYVRLAASGLASSEVAAELGERLLQRAITVETGIGWGYDFDVQTRWGSYRRGEPNAVVTAFGMDALTDLVSASGERRFEEALRSAAAFVSSELFVDSPVPYFAYYRGSRTRIHNASALLGAAVIRAGGRDGPGFAAARSALDAVVDAQREDGSWPYGDAPRLGWVDGFHTAYVLTSLAEAWRATDDERLLAAVRVGLALYVEKLIDPDGAPRATLEARFPVDIHAASSAITCLCRLSVLDPRAAPTAERVLGWTLARMRRRDGRFAFQLHPGWRNSIPYTRWGDAHMLLALAEYLRAAPA